MRFEQSRQIAAEVHKREIEVMTIIFLVLGHLLAAFIVYVLFLKGMYGSEVFAWQLVAAIPFGIVFTGVCRAALHLVLIRRKFLQFNDRGIRMTDHPTVAFDRFVSWSFTQPREDLRFVKITLKFKALIGINKWSMSLRDRAQIAELKNALRMHLPNAKETEAPIQPPRA